MAGETDKRKVATTRQARRLLLGLSFLLLVSTIGSALYDLHGIVDQYEQLATEVGRSFYQAINAMREWNYEHGGVYVKQTKDTLPNPYLTDPLRDVITTAGLRLTMINHAQMTRVLSELLKLPEGIHLHIMSLTPLRPENKPDAWEEQALVHLEQGNREEHAIVSGTGPSVFRYIAPLRTDETCIPCHNRPEETAHKIHGGISVSFSYESFQSAISAERRRTLILHGMFLGLGLGLIALLGTRLIHSVGALQSSLLTIKHLEGFLPICAKCKKIRAPGGDHRMQESWIAIESYIEARTDAEFTHGLCPQCSRELYPELFTNSDSPPA